LLQRQVDGVGAHVPAAAADRNPREWLMRARGWDYAARCAAPERLARRGWLGGSDLSAEGLAMVAAMEAGTTGRHCVPGALLGTPGATGWRSC
jgi:hypothetical protein